MCLTSRARTHRARARVGSGRVGSGLIFFGPDLSSTTDSHVHCGAHSGSGAKVICSRSNLFFKKMIMITIINNNFFIVDVIDYVSPTKQPHTIRPPPPCCTVGTMHVETIRSPFHFHGSNVHSLCFLAQTNLFCLLLFLSSGFVAVV